VLESVLKKYFDGEQIETTASNELLYRVKTINKGILSGTRISISAMVLLHNKEINFQNLASKIIETVKNAHNIGSRHISCTWLFCSESGGIYLHEAIATKENRRHKGMRNRFVVINTLNGTVSFGPGHKDNQKTSDTIRALFDKSKIIPRDQWEQAFSKVITGLTQF
jgi:hypothetical protein